MQTTNAILTGPFRDSARPQEDKLATCCIERCIESVNQIGAIHSVPRVRSEISLHAKAASTPYLGIPTYSYSFET